MKAYRQGDVILVVANSIPQGVRTNRPNLTLALGEVTGHSHRITQGTAELIDVQTAEGLSTYLSVGEDGALLTHEEHGKIALPKGVYQVWIQREYQPDGWTEVRD